MSVEGKRVDDYLAVEQKSRTQVSLQGFDYIECTDCHNFGEIGKIDLHDWKFSLMGLIPGLLKCAKGICPECQEMRKTFKGILERKNA